MNWWTVLIWPVVSGLIVATVVGLITFGRQVFQNPRKRSRSIIARHMRRMIGQIAGLDHHVGQGRSPSVVHVQSVRSALIEHRPAGEHFEAIGDHDLERKVEDWYQSANGSLHFEEDYVSGDESTLGRYGVDRGQWDKMWNQTYSRHAQLMIHANELVNLLVHKRPKLKGRKLSKRQRAERAQAMIMPPPS